MDFEPQSNTLTAASTLFGISSLGRLAKAGRKADGDPNVTVGDDLGVPVTKKTDNGDPASGTEGSANDFNTDGEAGNAGTINSPQVPDGGLKAHEAAGGHLIDRHVGKKDQELIDRSNGVGQKAPVGGSSSYSSLDAAEFFTSAILTARKADIDAYLKNPGSSTEAFDLEFNQPTGRWVPENGNNVQNVNSARVVIKADPSKPSGFTILTGFPIPEPDPKN